MEKKEGHRLRWSSVWKHCTDLKNGKASCNLCGAVLAYHSHASKSTYNLKRHLHLKHPTVGTLHRNKHGMLMLRFRSEEKVNRSAVWSHFTVSGDRKATCDLCHAELVYLNGSTHNLKRHLDFKHTSEELQNFKKSTDSQAEPELRDVLGANLASAVDRNKPIVLSSAIEAALNGLCGESAASTSTAASFVSVDGKDSQVNSDRHQVVISAHKAKLSLCKQRKYDQALIDMISLDFQLGTVVDDVGFRNFVTHLQPAYVLPHRRTVHETLLPQRVEQLTLIRRQELRHIPAFCLTIESWNRLDGPECFIAVTAHYICSRFKLQSRVIDCFEYLGDQQTITNLKDEFVRIAEDWQIQDKIVAVVTSNISEILTAIELIGWPRLPCFAHSLNAIASEAMSEIDDVVTKIRSVVEYFRFSLNATEMLRSIVQQMGLSDMDLEIDCGNNWSSTFKMMHRFHELREPIWNLLSLVTDVRLQPLLLADWDIIARACELLMPLYEATAELRSAAYMSASKAIVIVHGVLRLSREQLAKSGHPPTIEKMASVIISNLTNWFGNTELNPLLAESMLLDPRFKKTGFTDVTAMDAAVRSIVETASAGGADGKSGNTAETVSRSSGSKSKNVGAAVNAAGDQHRPVMSASVWAEYDQQVSSAAFSSASSSSSRSVSAAAATNPSASSKLSTSAAASNDDSAWSVWAEYDRKVSNTSSSEKPDDDAARQMQRFLDEPLLNRQSCCLDWWQSREVLYSRLVPVVKTRLCIVANSTSSDFVFSENAPILNMRRQSLSARETSHVVFLHSNV